MTKFIYDTKAIMTEAWECARFLREERSERYPTLKAAFAVALKRAWRHAIVDKEAMVAQEKANIEKSSSGRRYLERLEVAESEGLSHGKAWLQNEMAWRFGGEMVCYVYPN
ncbi:TPA: hypothetical protein MDT29_000876 [Klebsiella pneumoniae]|nr:hypothetical protein [Klebsiella pneumoniae]HBV3020937.1 hypothetical protein [Klebsiella pneumoniae]HBV3057517.1 hypothetical protein [Klebsiella pneumoniae]